MAKSKFEKILEEQLQSIEQEEDSVVRINQIRDQIAQLEAQIGELKQQMAQEMEGMNGALAVSIRKLVPGLSVNLDGGKCRVSHMSNSLSMRPDFTSGRWEIEPNKTGRRFRKHHGPVDLAHDVGPLANNVGAFFKKRYKRLNNEGRAIKHVGVSKTQASGHYV
jgi:hypothetical protein